MLNYYLRVGWRSFRRNKFFTTINVICLSIGICFSLLTGLFCWEEMHVNSGLRNTDRQFFMKSIYPQKDMGLEIASISPLAKAAKEDYPNLIANYYRYNPVTTVVSAGEKHFKEDVAIGDTTMIRMFGFKLLHGDPSKAFADVSSAVITQELASKLFGTVDAIGKTISIQTTQADVKQDYKVSAVLSTIPRNSVTKLKADDNFTVFVPTEGSRYFGNTDASLEWDHTNQVSFIELQPGIDPATVTAALNSLLRKNSPDYIWKNLKASIVPVRSYYLDENNGAISRMIRILLLIAVFILFMIIVNFINISIGTSQHRLKEIGLRKLFGSPRKSLVAQAIAETAIITMIAFILSAIGYELSRSLFSNVLNSDLPHLWQLSAAEYLCIGALFLVTVIAAGFYPAFILSSTGLLLAVKGKIAQATGGLQLKRALLLFQFSLTAMVFICTIQVSRQVNYIFKKDLGYNREQLMVISAFPKKWDSADVIHMKNFIGGLTKLANIQSAALSYDLPDGVPSQNIAVYPKGTTDKSQSMSLPLVICDENYASTYAIGMKVGDFFGTSKDGLVLNETAVKQLGFTSENIIGQQVKTGAGTTLTVKGVTHDYHFSTLQDKIGPLGFAYVRSKYRYVTLRIGTQDISRTIAAVKDAWADFSPTAPFEYSFMDEHFKNLYLSELRMQKASIIATIVNIIIVLLGIIGVVAFMLAKKEKEIAIRKVLGAGAKQIIAIFTKEYGVLLILSNVVAWPLAYWVSNALLQNFAYRVGQSILVYFVVFITLCILSFAIIGLQCFKTAVARPIDGLRQE